ncbi:MAG: hypothetical protein NTV51_22160 [Verrucomicrobia bacterium]|nr:hypothetical protein [Verrucomicrobiota bacterium]
MTFRQLLTLGLTTLLAGRACAEEREQERHTWALGVERTNSVGHVTSWTAAGPLLFAKDASEGARTSGFRPFWVQTKEPNGDLRAGLALYPIFTYRADAETYAWSFFELIKRSGRKEGAPAPKSILESGQAFDIWPFWFSRQAQDPADSYRALFPIYGTIKSRLGYERLSWTLFPFYVQTEKRGATTTSTPWPFIRTTRGAAHGFALWPLFGWQERPGESRDEFYLWPLGYNNTRQPAADAPAGTAPSRQIGALPFYARSTAPGFINEDYGWPFFGYTDRTQPWRYHETRYFWPFFVQGRGDDRYVNRWGPFYTHSIIKGNDKTWIAWPFFRQVRWTTDNVAQTKTQFLYVLYWSLDQRSLSNPQAAHAHVRHVWPLFSTWDNGAGRRQTLALSPFEVFFPGNTKVREVWSPLFALYRSDQRAPGHVRRSLLWDLVSWETGAPKPVSSAADPAPVAAVAAPREERIAVGRGLLGLRRPTGERAWRLFWLDFPSKQASVSTASVR